MTSIHSTPPSPTSPASRRRKPSPARSLAWVLAALLVLALVTLLILNNGRGRMTAVTAFGADPANYGTIALAVDPASVVDGWPATAGDATGAYRLAAGGYTASVLSRRPYDDFLRDTVRQPARPGELPLLQHLLEGSRHGQAAPFGADPAALINYEHTLPELDALYVLGQVAMRQAGLLAARNHPGDAAAARKLYEAAFILGVHLFQERIVHRELEYGYRLISQSLGGLIALAKKHDEPERAARLLDRRTRFNDYVNSRLQPVWDKLSAINDVSRSGDLADRHMGDVTAIAARDAADPMWRTEAILRLGKARHDATRPADREAAQRELQKLLSTLTDPRLKLAAQEALALTAAQRMHAR